MKAGHWVLLVLGLALLTAAIVLSAPAGGHRSALDRTPRGYRAALAYLQAGGTDAEVWTEPFEALGADGGGGGGDGTTLVIAWPLARPLSAADRASLVAWVRRGNRAVLLLDPETEPPFELVEVALDALLTKDTATPPWSWADWSAWAEERRTARGDHGTLALGDPTWRLTCPPSGYALATGSDGVPRACVSALGGGEVVLLSDATVWQNDHLGKADNLALLDALLAGRVVRFDEWHHDVAFVASTIPKHVPALFAAHLGAVWLGALLVLARRFGDPLPPAALAGPSMARALHALATLHRGSGHGPDAAARLYALARARAARKGVDPDLLPRPPQNPGDAAFTAWAAALARAQAEHRI